MNDMYSFKSVLADTLSVRESKAIETALNLFQSPQELLTASQHELMQIHGIGPKKAKQVIAAIQLAKLLNTPKGKPAIIRSPQDAFELLQAELAYLPKEHFVCLFLNTKNHVIAKETISIGSLNAAIVTPRCVFRAAIKRNSASVICAHNHPSFDPTASSEDIQLTKRLVEAGEIIGIQILDHIIIGEHRYVSLKELGYM